MNSSKAIGMILKRQYKEHKVIVKGSKYAKVLQMKSHCYRLKTFYIFRKVPHEKMQRFRQGQGV